jgi:glycosyltransferase involved in cell wall biosynthesis
MDEQRMMDNALVSVILPVYNGEKFLAQAVENVLKQACRPLEIIVVDDGSTDGTAQVAAGFAGQIRYYYQPNSGPAAARNFGIRMAKGEFIAFIDADDLWPDDKLSMQMACFEAFSEVEIVQGLISRIILPDLVKGRIIGAEINYPFIYSNLGAMIIRRCVFDKIGWFAEDLRFHEDTDFWLRAMEAEISILVQRKLALVYRIHGLNLTTGVGLVRTGFLNILRRSIHRRRKSSGFVKPVPRLTFIPDLMKKDQQVDHREKKELPSCPLVSIVLYYNTCPVKIGQAFTSICDQDYRPIELIIVGSQLDQVQKPSTDTFNQVVFVEGGSDLASRLNAALERSNGEMIAFLDAESVWTPGKLKTQVAYLLEHPADGYVVGKSRHVLAPDLKYPSGLIEGFFLRKSLGDLLGTLMVRRSTFVQVDGFESGYPGLEETDWLLRARDKGFLQKMLPDIFLLRFVQPDSHIVGIEQIKASLLKSVRSSVHRKRNGS